MTTSPLRWPATIVLAFAVAFLHFALSGGGIAHAQNTVVAIDVGDVTGNTGTSVGPINGCFQVQSGATYTLDVVVRDVKDLVAGQFTLRFEGTGTEESGTLTDQSVADSLLNHPSPPVTDNAVIDPDTSGQVPDSSGQHILVVSIEGAIGSGGATGSGVLARFTLTAPARPGMVELTLAQTTLVDSQAIGIPQTTQDARLAVDTACPAATASPSAAPNPSLTAGPSGGPSVTSGASPPTSQSPTARTASPTPAGLANESGGGGGLPLAAWIGIGLVATAVIIGGGLLIRNPGLRRRLTGRS